MESSYRRCVMVQGGERGFCSPMRQLEASANTFVPAMIAAVVLGFCLNSPFPIDRYLQVEGMSEVWADRVAGLFVLAVPALWIAIDGGLRRATVGMRRRKLEFRCEDGRPPTFLRCLLRIMLGIVLLPVFPLLLVLAYADRRRRMLADIVCGTVVCFCGDE